VATQAVLRVLPQSLPRLQPDRSHWRLPELAGRLTEIASATEPAGLTAAFGLVHECQRSGECAAWITTMHSVFFPPDVAESGIDLDALAVVRTPNAAIVARAADRLVRSGTFALVVADIGPHEAIPMPLLSRLNGLARKYHAAVVFLTQKGGTASAIGSLISLRVQARRQRTGIDRFEWMLDVLKDKRHGPTWRYAEACRGPAGLR